MSRTNWKQVEREAAALFGTRRFPANMGGRLDLGNGDSWFLGQVKNPQRLSLAEIERLAVEMESAGFQADRIGVLVVKRSAGSGVPTSRLIVMTENAWRAFLRRLDETTKEAA